MHVTVNKVIYLLGGVGLAGKVLAKLVGRKMSHMGCGDSFVISSFLLHEFKSVLYIES